jgi:hypothetical protein
MPEMSLKISRLTFKTGMLPGADGATGRHGTAFANNTRPEMPSPRPISRCAVILRTLSAIMLGLAISTAVLTFALRLVHCYRPDLFLLPLKSAMSLIFIGVAFACFQFAAPRTRNEVVLGLMVSVAFILWGTEQFLSDRSIVAFIDDIVVLFFVLDLSILIYGHLRPRRRPAGTELG